MNRIVHTHTHSFTNCPFLLHIKRFRILIKHFQIKPKLRDFFTLQLRNSKVF